MVEIGGRETAKGEWGAGEEDNSMAVLRTSKYLIVHNILFPNNSTTINPRWKTEENRIQISVVPIPGLLEKSVKT